MESLGVDSYLWFWENPYFAETSKFYKARADGVLEEANDTLRKFYL